MPRRILSLVALPLALAACSTTGPAATHAATTSPSAQPASTGGAPTTAPTPRPTVVPTASAFTPALYGYELTVPAGWYAAPAIFKWDGASAPGDGDPTVDRLGGPGKASAFVFAAPTTSSLDGLVRDTIKWTVRDHGDTCPATTPDVTEPIRFGGEQAMFLGWNCGILINQVVAVHDGMAYTMVVRDPGVAAATDAADRALLEQLLNSVVFRT